MDFSQIIQTNGNIVLSDIRNFDLRNTLDSGQSFRWKELAENKWSAIAHSRLIEIEILGKDLIIYSTTREEFESVWQQYFAFATDYEELFSLFGQNEVMGQAIAFAPGIRVLKQDPFETLISFILSQNNNVKRIKGLVERLCENFGSKIGDSYAFPTLAQMQGVSVEDMSPVRSGFRAKYIVDAVNKLASGEIILDNLYSMTTEEARQELMKIYGVGKKVADCVLLYGFARTECIPEDVWMKRVMAQYFPQGMPESLYKYGGIAQQTLFHYARNCAGAVEK